MIGDAAIPTTFCADAARANGAPLYGSATRADVWLLLEYTGEWQQDATRHNDLPVAVQAWLAAQQAAVPGSRVQFIAQDRRRVASTFFVAAATAERQTLYRFAWQSAADLTRLDIARLLAGDLQGAETVAEPMVLICVNGKHDPCCARYGTGVYLALADRLGSRVWQSTHQGGHRYAAVGIVLPAGIQYGYLDVTNAAALADMLGAEQLMLQYYRGRTFYDGPVNAADYFVRRTCDLHEHEALTLTDSTPISEMKWRIRFHDRYGQHHALVVLQIDSQPTLVSCDPVKWKTQPRYRLISHRIWSDEQHATA